MWRAKINYFDVTSFCVRMYTDIQEVHINGRISKFIYSETGDPGVKKHL